MTETKGYSHGSLRGGPPIRKRGYHRALLRGAPWALHKKAHIGIVNALLEEMFKPSPWVKMLGLSAWVDEPPIKILYENKET